MSFLLYGDDLPHLSASLPALTTIRIPPLCMGVIPHEVRISRGPGPLSELWIVRLPLAWADLNLIVDQGPVDPVDGHVATRVFNLSQRTVRIARGQIISRLVSLRME